MQAFLAFFSKNFAKNFYEIFWYFLCNIHKYFLSLFNQKLNFKMRESKKDMSF